MNKFRQLFVTKISVLVTFVALAGSASAGAVSKADAASPYPTIYGSVVYSDNVTSAQDVGLYYVSTEDATPSLILQGPYALHGGVCIDGIYYASAILNDVPTVKAYDLSSGSLVASFTTTIDVMAPAGYALDPVTKDVYGITYGETVNECQFSKLTFSLSGVTVEKIASLYVEDYWLALAFDSAGQLYAISRDNVYMYAFLNKMDKTTGAYTPVGKIEGGGWLYPQYKSGACIDPETNLMYINVCPTLTTGSGVNTGYLYSVNLATATAQKIYQYTDNAEIMGMFIPEKPTPGGAPGACQEITPVFTDATMKGTVAVKTPSVTFDGSVPEGTVDIVVRCNGKTVGTAEGRNYDTVVDVAVDLTGFTPGFYTFSVYAENDLGKGPVSDSQQVWVGADTPAATSATLKYENNTMTVSWLAVTESVNGGYIDLDNLTYTVKRSDGSVAASGVKDLSFSEYVAEPSKQTTYYYTVEAVNGTLISAPAQTNTVTIGALKPPYFSDFDSGLDGWTIINANNDAYTWEAKNGGVQIRYNATLDMDDWLISPGLKLQAGMTYSIGFATKCYTYPEKLEVKYGSGNTVAELTETLIAPFEITNNQDYEEQEEFFVPAADGIYFFGFHGMSDADAMVLYVKNIQITGGALAQAPDAVSDFVAAPAVNGSLECLVSFKAPTQTVNHQALTSLTKIDLMRNGELVKTFTEPAPGASLSYIDKLTAGGQITYTAVAYNEEGAGVEAVASAFVGIDVPAVPVNLRITPTNVNGQVVFSWDPVTVDVNGNPIPAGEVTYSVARYYVGWTEIADNLTSPSYSYQAVASGQEFIQLAVYAHNKAGRSEIAASEPTPVGTPYDGMKESFANGRLGNYIWYQRGINGGTAGLFNDESVDEVMSQDGDNGFLGIYGEKEGMGATFYSGLISLKKLREPVLSFGINCFTIDVWNEVSVYIREQSEQEWNTLIDTSRVTDLCTRLGWNTVTLPLTAYEGRVIQLGFSSVTEYYQYTFFDNIVVGEKDESYVSEITDAPNPTIITSAAGSLEIIDASGLAYVVSSINGTVVASGIGGDRTSLSLSPGIYVVKVGNQVSKVMIR